VACLSISAWVREQLMLERAARTNVALTTPQPFRERMVRFWSNHLVVPVIKQPTAVLAGPYEREVIRPHTTGKFADMLLASARNPGMTYFLDNHLSAGPNSAYGQRHKIGLNENLGREILELHTLGVDGGYTQADVIALSKGITGWAFWPNAGRPENRDPKNAGRTPGAFNYFDEWHEPGPIVLMGKSYGQSGVAQGEAMLHDVARHPATARFLAGKLAAHFIGDDPPRAVVKRLAAVYLAHDTDLAEVCRALVEAPEAWAAAQSKLKQPEDYVLSGMRSLNLTLADNVVPAPSMYRFPGYRPPPASAGAPYSLAYDAAASMGQKPMGAPGPQGWYDRWADWSSADSLLKRVEWSLATATAHADRVEDPVRYLDQTLGGLASQDLRDSVKRAATKDQAIGLVLASPDFQRR